MGVAALVLAAGACGDSPTSPTGLSISAISPAAGSTLGGTAVTISGKGFASDATVTIGGATATRVAVQGGAAISATTPPSAGAGARDVVVTTGGRTATLARGFTFVAPSGANQPPVITGIRSTGLRANQPSGFADLDETITLTATVSDVETSTGALAYAWSGPGVFGDPGATISWRAPNMLSPIPSTVVVALTVSEAYTEGGVSHTNTASRTFVVDVHDSQKEILDMGEDFLTLFSRSEVPADQVLHNFSTTCDDGSGRAAEQRDVEKNRREFLQDFSRFRLTRMPPVTFNFGRSCPSPNGPRRADACSKFTVHWEVTHKNPPDAGKREITDGIDYVTAVLENGRWYLCHSDFAGTVTNPLTGLTRHVTW